MTAHRDPERISRQRRPGFALRLLAVAGLLVLSLAGLSSAAATQSRLAEAIRAQRSRLEAAPRDVVLLNDLANLLELAGDLDGAEEVYRRALEVDPERVATIYNLALLHAEAGRRRLAERGFRRAVELDPEHAWSHYQLGTLAAAAGNRNKAIDRYARAFRLERRLTLPEFNPHVIDNRYVTEALLLAHAADSAAAAVPRIYRDPERVRDLLLPPLEASAEEPPESDRPATPGGGGVPRSAGGVGEALREMDDPSAPAAREPGRTETEIAPPGSGVPAQEAGRGQPGRRVIRQPVVSAPEQPPTAAAPPPAAPEVSPQPAGETTPRAEGVRPEPVEPPPAPPAPEPPELPEATPEAPPFEPGLASTGLLELRLVPVPQDQLAALAADPL